MAKKETIKFWSELTKPANMSIESLRTLRLLVGDQSKEDKLSYVNVGDVMGMPIAIITSEADLDKFKIGDGACYIPGYSKLPSNNFRVSSNYKTDDSSAVLQVAFGSGWVFTREGDSGGSVIAWQDWTKISGGGSVYADIVVSDNMDISVGVNELFTIILPGVSLEWTAGKILFLSNQINKEEIGIYKIISYSNSPIPGQGVFYLVTRLYKWDDFDIVRTGKGLHYSLYDGRIIASLVFKEILLESELNLQNKYFVNAANKAYLDRIGVTSTASSTSNDLQIDMSKDKQLHINTNTATTDGAITFTNAEEGYETLVIVENNAKAFHLLVPTMSGAKPVVNMYNNTGYIAFTASKSAEIHAIVINGKIRLTAKTQS